MARVNLDSKVWTDPRVSRLAKRFGWSIREAVGSLSAVWNLAYNRKSDLVSVKDIDTVSETPEFAKAMLEEELADSTEYDQTIRIRGVNERFQYLLSQSKRGRSGGLAKARNAASDCLAEHNDRSGLPLDHDPDHDPDKDHSESAKPLRDECIRLAGLLHRLIANNSPESATAKLSGKAFGRRIHKWGDSIDKLERIDGISFDKIETAIRWSQADPFWSSNILSGDTLRKQYDKLLAQMSRGPDVKSRGTDEPRGLNIL